MDLSPDPTSAQHAFATCTRDISISIVGRQFNARKQEEMQAVLRNWSMKCFQTFPAQLSFLSLKFFKLIRKVSSLQCCSLIKLLPSVLQKIIVALKFDSWYFFFPFFFPILWHLLRERKLRPKDIQGSNGDIYYNYQFYSYLRLCQQRIFTLMNLTLCSKVSLHEWMFGYGLVFNVSSRTPYANCCQLMSTTKGPDNPRVQGHKVYVASTARLRVSHSSHRS